MDRYPEPELLNWIEGNKSGATLALGGSAGPPRTLQDLVAISKDPDETAKALQFNNVLMTGGMDQGDPGLRNLITGFYEKSKVHVTEDDVVVTPGTTGSLSLIFHALIKPGDHVVCAYPAYEGLNGIPQGLGARVEYWRMRAENNWKASLDDLKALLTPQTKMLILNNPHNPTGYVFSTAEQAEIVKLAAQHNIIVFADEIFRPLFHGCEVPTSMVEHSNYDRTIVAGSLSKVWGFSGIRIGWAVSRNREILAAVLKARKWLVSAVSAADEAVAKEVLSQRCSDRIVAVTLANAKANLAVLERFVHDHRDVVWAFPSQGAATAFVKFMSPQTGAPVDDMVFCRRVKEECGLLLSPGSRTFGVAEKGDFKGFVRVHLTIAPEKFKEGFERIGEFILSRRMEEVGI